MFHNRAILKNTKRVNFLKKQGVKLVEINYRCLSGEIDLIMQDKETLAFVEICYRAKNDYGSTLVSEDQVNIQKLISAANHYV